MAKSKNKTTKPRGLSITRNGNNYTCKWKIGASNYGAGQKAQYTKNGKTWTNYTVGTTTTNFTLTDANLKYLAFRVQGCQKKYKKGGKTVKPTWSDWATSGAWSAVNPNKPSLEYESVSANAGKFEWKVSTSNTDRAVFDNVVVQKQLRRDNENNPTKEFAESLDDSEILGKNMSEIRNAFYEWAGDDTVKFSSKEFMSMLA